MKPISLKSLVLFVLLTSFLNTFGQEVNEGEKLFKSNCKSCHSIGKGRVVGPDLKNVSERRTEEWLQKFIKNPGDMIASDADAKKLFEEYDPVIMPSHSALSDQDISSILGYIKTAGEEPIVDTKATKPTKETATPIKTNNSVNNLLLYLIFGLIGSCLIILTLLLYLIFKFKK